MIGRRYKLPDNTQGLERFVVGGSPTELDEFRRTYATGLSARMNDPKDLGEPALPARLSPLRYAIREELRGVLQSMLIRERPLIDHVFEDDDAARAFDIGTSLIGYRPGDRPG